MSWLSSVGNFLGNVGKTVGSVAKSVATPLASFAAGLVPGIGPLLSKGVDALGNKLLGDEAQVGSQNTQTPVAAYLATQQAPAPDLGSSPVASALANSTITNSFLGIGGSDKGVFGIGDGKKGVFGIGTGKNKAAAAARAQAEDAALGEGLSPKEVKLAGDRAAEKAAAGVDDDGNPKEDKSLMYVLLAAAAAVILG